MLVKVVLVDEGSKWMGIPAIGVPSGAIMSTGSVGAGPSSNPSGATRVRMPGCQPRRRAVTDANDTVPPKRKPFGTRSWVMGPMTRKLMDKRPRNDLIEREAVTGAIVTQAAGRVNENAQQAKVSVMDQEEKRSRSCERLLSPPGIAQTEILLRISTPRIATDTHTRSTQPSRHPRSRSQPARPVHWSRRLRQKGRGHWSGRRHQRQPGPPRPA